MDKKIDTLENLIAKIEVHKLTVKQVQAEEKKLDDLWVNGYNCGIQDGLEAAINIIRQIEAEQYRKITAAYVKRAKK